MIRTVRAYVRLARSPNSPRQPWKLEASTNPNPRPLTVGQGHSERELHTVRFAIDLDVDDSIFNPKDWPTVELELSEAAADKLAIAVVGQGDAPAEVEVER